MSVSPPISLWPSPGSEGKIEIEVAANDPEVAAIEALDRGDREAALGLLMDAYGGALYRFCRQMVKDEALAEDVHQLTFLQAYEGFEGFGRRARLRTWLFSIARHRCLDALKATRRRRARIQLVEELPESTSEETAADERMAQRTLAEALGHCLGELSPRIRDAVLLRFQEGATYPEMAVICGERAPTLQARVVRALPMLRRCLQVQGHSL